MSDSVTPEADIPDAPLQDAGSGTCEMVERVVAFFLGGERYALPIERVKEVQQIVAFSEVPAGGIGVVGMVNLRGRVIPAVDMRQIVGLERRAYTLETPMVIAEVGDELVAIVVDEVQDVFALPVGCLQDAPALHQLSSKMIGVARLDDGLVYVLDLDRIIGSGLFGGAS